MPSTELIWRTPRGDFAGVTVHSPDAAHPDRVLLVIGRDMTLRIPITEARLLAQALTDAADIDPAPPRRVIPIHAAPPAALYHELD